MERISNYWYVPGFAELPYRKPNPEEVVDHVCDFTGVDLETLRQRSRKLEIVEARQWAVSLLHTFCPHLKQQQIVELLAPGISERTMVYHCLNKVSAMLETEEEYRQRYEDCLETLKTKLRHDNITKSERLDSGTAGSPAQ